ncbi:MAG: type II toxin-antitoxin system PemK/MazF family toxin [Pirellulales bacterium]
MPFQQGQIVRVELFDPQEQNPKRRPVLIISPTEDIRPGGRVAVLAISSAIERPLPSGHFLLPWHPKGRVRTGLSKPSVLKANWGQWVNVDELREIAGSAPPSTVKEVLNWLRAQKTSLPGLRWD